MSLERRPNVPLISTLLVESECARSAGSNMLSDLDYINERLDAMGELTLASIDTTALRQGQDYWTARQVAHTHFAEAHVNGLRRSINMSSLGVHAAALQRLEKTLVAAPIGRLDSEAALLKAARAILALPPPATCTEMGPPKLENRGLPEGTRDADDEALRRLRSLSQKRLLDSKGPHLSIS